MRWKDGRQSQNIEDRRTGGGMRRAAPALGGGAILVIVVFSLLTGQDPRRVADIVSQVPAATTQQPGPGGAPPAQDEASRFVSAVLADTEDTWNRVFAESNQRYEPPTLVLYNDEVQSACGYSTAATGPFYCPADRKVYLDLSFFRELHERFGAPGDFAQAYVIAHEIGHHLQTILGISADVARMEAQMNETGRNAMSVRQELQADCFAGVWGFHANRDRKMLEPGDVEEGLRAAASIGDDRLTGGRVSPESWTHGSSDQRVTWLRRGLETGRLDACDTFKE